MLSSRFVSFHGELVKSQKFCVRFLARLQERDMRTVTGRLLFYTTRECNIPGNSFERHLAGLNPVCVMHLKVQRLTGKSH